jgi:hypothetical protein
VHCAGPSEVQRGGVRSDGVPEGCGAGCSAGPGVPGSAVRRAAEHQPGHEEPGLPVHLAGFLPVDQPRTVLPANHAVWDEVAARLPELHCSLTVRRVVDRMPCLSADAGLLPEEYQHAATVLGILANTYRYVSACRPAGLAASVGGPWRVVCAGWDGGARACPTST